tara:strand:+ start:34171 stop:34530 length:360 start_codon:yes stop_codon:yes gene_type:complete
MTPEKAYTVANNLAPGVIHRWSPSKNIGLEFMGGYVLLRAGKALPSESDVTAHEDVYDALVAKVQLMNTWKAAMQAADVSMPRSTEEVIGTMSDEQKAKLPEYTRDAYAAKVTLRGTKP